MQPRTFLLAVELNVALDHGGYSMQVRGKGGELVARFPSLMSSLHFLIALWPARNSSLAGLGLKLEWRRLRLGVRRRSAILTQDA